MKKAVVVKLTPKGKDDNSNYSYVVTFDNNDCGYYTCKDEKGAPFVVGEETEYDLETRTGKTGSSYTKIKSPNQAKGYSGGGGYGGKSAYVPKPPEQIKQETRLNARSMLMRYAVDLWIADKITVEKIQETFEQLTGIYDSSIEDINLG